MGGLIPLQRVPAGVKLLGLAGASAGLFMLSDPLALAVILAAVILLAWAADALTAVTDLRPLALILALSAVAHALLGDWMLGIVVCLRIAALVTLAGVISATTPFSAMLAVFDRLLGPLRWAGMPTRPIGVALAMTLRFAPMLTLRWRTLRSAWAARSPRRPGWRLLVPFIIGALEDADRAAEALAARGGFTEK